MKAREWIDQGLNRNPELIDLLKDFPLLDGETETRDMRSRVERESSGGRQTSIRWQEITVIVVLTFKGLLSKQTAVPRQSGSKAQKFGIQEVVKCQITTVK